MVASGSIALPEPKRCQNLCRHMASLFHNIYITAMNITIHNTILGIETVQPGINVCMLMDVVIWLYMNSKKLVLQRDDIRRSFTYLYITSFPTCYRPQSKVNDVIISSKTIHLFSKIMWWIEFYHPRYKKWKSFEWCSKSFWFPFCGDCVRSCLKSCF